MMLSVGMRLHFCDLYMIESWTKYAIQATRIIPSDFRYPEGTYLDHKAPTVSQPSDGITAPSLISISRIHV